MKARDVWHVTDSAVNPLAARLLTCEFACLRISLT